MEIVVSKINSGSIVWNNEEVKTQLSSKLESMKNLVVTEENLKESQSLQKDLASLRIQIDSQRKRIKKELQKPVDEFDAACKELLAIVAEVEHPLKRQIEAFEESDRAARADRIKDKIAVKQAKWNLPEKYFLQVSVRDKWLNKTAKDKDIEAELDEMFSVLAAKAEGEKNDKEAIIKSCEVQSVGLYATISPELFISQYDLGIPLSAIIAKIGEEAERRKAEELRRAEEAHSADEVEEAEVAEVSGPVESFQPEKEIEERDYPCAREEESVVRCILEISGTRTQLGKLKEYMVAHEIKYYQIRR